MQSPASQTPSGGSSAQETWTRKRKRRIVSCLICRRMKCRCDFKDNSDTCARCQALRLPCLKAEDIVDVPLTTVEAVPIQAESQILSRLTELERTINGLKEILQPSQAKSFPQRHAEDPGSVPSNTSTALNMAVEDERDCEKIEAADLGVQNSPAEVVRKVDKQLSGGYRRQLDGFEDVVTLGMLNEEAASNLLERFIRRRRNMLLIDHEADLSSKGKLRQISPFLHAVCCVVEMRHSYLDPGEVDQHREVYEYVRQVLGQAMVASPLSLEDLTAILIMALYASAPSRGPEYKDSWLMSGTCAQQAMLCIDFSGIVSRLNRGEPFPEDQRAMRVWTNICLVNLHWAASTGRPPTVPQDYLQQCQMLLNFDSATMLDGMLYAEISLFSTLNNLLGSGMRRPIRVHDEEFKSWEQKWSHLLERPTATTLRLGYRIALLIFSRRSLDSISLHEKRNNIARNENAHQTRGVAPTDTQEVTYSLAVKAIAAFVDIDANICEHLPSFYLVSAAYCLLILSQYDGDYVSLYDTQVIQLLQEMGRRINQSKTLSTAIRFGIDRAMAKVQSRMGVLEVTPPKIDADEYARSFEAQNLLSPPNNEDIVLVTNDADDLSIFFSGGYISTNF